MIRTPVNPPVQVWARERAGYQQDNLETRSPKLAKWEAAKRRPTFKQAESFARAVHVPVGRLFLSEPLPAETIPVADFRTIAGTPVANPSRNLLNVIRACQERQLWCRNFARLVAREPLPFIASATMGSSPERIAGQMRITLGFGVGARRTSRTWSESLRKFMTAADNAGILLMISGIAQSNTNLRLDPDEFRDFALSDPLAPLVFVDGANAKATQTFTLVHELAHFWLGTSAFPDCQAAPTPASGTTRCGVTWPPPNSLCRPASLHAELHTD